MDVFLVSKLNVKLSSLLIGIMIWLFMSYVEWAKNIFMIYMNQVPTGGPLTALNSSRWAVVLAFCRFGELSIRFVA